MKFDLIAHGDAMKPQVRTCRKSPGYVTIVNDQGIAGRNQRLAVEVNPTTGRYVVTIFDHRGTRIIAEGWFEDSGINEAPRI